MATLKMIQKVMFMRLALGGAEAILAGSLPVYGSRAASRFLVQRRLETKRSKRGRGHDTAGMDAMDFMEWWTSGLSIDLTRKIAALKTPRKRVSRGPSTSLRISPAGSDARKTAQHRSLTCDFFESHRVFNPGHPVAAL